jgi:hypothetical protein
LRQASSPFQSLRCALKYQFYILTLHSMSDKLDLKTSSPGLYVLFLLPLLYVNFQRRFFKGPSHVQYSNIKACYRGNYYARRRYEISRPTSLRLTPILWKTRTIYTIHCPFPDSFAVYYCDYATLDFASIYLPRFTSDAGLLFLHQDLRVHYH